MNFFIKYIRKIAMLVMSFYNHRIINYKNITIISNNCIAGFIYHEFRLKFNSPTINLQMSPGDFIKFCKNIKRYLDVELEECGQVTPDGRKVDYPVGKLNDIVIHFQHYHTFDEAKQKWDDRKKRIIWDRIYLILVDAYSEGSYCTDKMVDEFMSLNYGKKIFLTGEDSHSRDGRFYLKGLKAGNKLWCDYTGKFSTKKFYHQFKFSEWINA